ncbi:hypothetical protein ACH82I_10635 [Brevibacterium sp. GP-SGM9]|uniref:hypothetical protein n=1 Tax=unclassified Brevibacterium TaxID=2614124 RepID=UPI001E2AAC86|nr:MULTISPECIES: hypothetical protein [unclassified Brevibacterium]MDK8433617.1 hypothetical protein [Brevibacterium sp. H-BE7]
MTENGRDAVSDGSLLDRMYPRKPVWRFLYFALIILTSVLICLSVGISIWSQIGEDGWVTKAALAVLSWLVTLPLLLGSVCWWVVLISRPRRLPAPERLSPVRASRRG